MVAVVLVEVAVLVAVALVVVGFTPYLTLSLPGGALSTKNTIAPEYWPPTLSPCARRHATNSSVAIDPTCS